MLSKELCQRIVDATNAINDWSRYDVQSPTGIWFHFEHFFIKRNVSPDFDELLKFIELTIPQYPNRFFGITRINRYQPGDHCEEHRDIAEFRKWTLLIQMSDPSTYEGGDLILDDVPVSREQGSYVLFESHVNRHVVLPVTKGLRYSIVHWAYETA
jgi:hypothetical protein